jgi:photosystem II stability/assembly factor-like uncharacterized protein
VAIGAQSAGSPVGSIAAITTDGGNIWASTPILSGVSYLSSVACPTTKTCIAVGDRTVGNAIYGKVIMSTDGGRTWALASALPKSIGHLSSISCPNKSFCITVGRSVDQTAATAAALATTNAGHTWKRVNLPKGEEELSSVACVNRRKCVADGIMDASIGDPSAGNRLSIIVTSDGGSTWKQSSLPGGSQPAAGIPSFEGLTCFARTHCVIVGNAEPGDGNPTGLIIQSTDAGRSWFYNPVPPNTNFLNAVSCVSVSRCVVAGGGIEPRGGVVQGLLTTDDGGHTWTARNVPSTAAGLDGVSCPTTSRCIAVGFALSAANPTAEPGAVVVTHDGGRTWAAPY